MIHPTVKEHHKTTQGISIHLMQHARKRPCAGVLSFWDAWMLPRTQHHHHLHIGRSCKLEPQINTADPRKCASDPASAGAKEATMKSIIEYRHTHRCLPCLALQGHGDPPVHLQAPYQDNCRPTAAATARLMLQSKCTSRWYVYVT